MRFNFCGELKFSPMDSRRPYLREGVSKKGKQWRSINFGVAAETNNRAYVEMFGQMEQDEIRTKDTDNKDIVIAWADRNDPGVISTVANYRKRVIALEGKERKEFITDWDAIQYIIDNLDDIKDKKYIVTGDVTKDFFNGQVSNRFTIRNIYAPKEGAKNKLTINAEIYFTADDIDLADWKEEKRINISAYTREYIDKEEPNAFVAQNFVFDCSKVDFTNERHVNMLKIRGKQLGLEFSDKGAPKITLKKNKVYQQSVVINYVNGAETIEFGYDQLTEAQKEFVDMGLKTVEDFRPRGQIYGNRIVVFKITDFDLTGTYADGIVMSELTTKEFGEMVYQPVIEEKAEDALGDAMNPPDEVPFKEDDGLDDLEDLFS